MPYQLSMPLPQPDPSPSLPPLSTGITGLQLLQQLQEEQLPGHAGVEKMLVAAGMASSDVLGALLLRGASHRAAGSFPFCNVVSRLHTGEAAEAPAPHTHDAGVCGLL